MSGSGPFRHAYHLGHTDRYLLWRIRQTLFKQLAANGCTQLLPPRPQPAGSPLLMDDTTTSCADFHKLVEAVELQLAKRATRSKAPGDAKKATAAAAPAAAPADGQAGTVSALLLNWQAGFSILDGFEPALTVAAVRPPSTLFVALFCRAERANVATYDLGVEYAGRLGATELVIVSRIKPTPDVSKRMALDNRKHGALHVSCRLYPELIVRAMEHERTRPHRARSPERTASLLRVLKVPPGMMKQILASDPLIRHLNLAPDTVVDIAAPGENPDWRAVLREGVI